VLLVALPLVVSSLSWTVMTFVDRMFLRWESGAAMSAAFGASAVWFAMACLPLGICAYANTFVAQYHGDRQPERIGCVVWQAAWIALGCAPVALLAIPLAPAMFRLAGHSPEITELEIRYFQTLAVGAPAMWLAQALCAFYGGRGLTRVNMWVDAAFAGLNVVLDYAWIFGKWGFPAMGIAGAGWATTASLWLKAATFALLVLRSGNRREFGTARGMRFDGQLLRRLIRFGGPSGLQMLLDVIGFTVFVMLIGRLGVVEAEATGMAFSVSTLAFMPVWGLSLAATILVGQHLGEDRDDLAERATWNSLGLALTYMAAISTLYVFLPDLLLYGFFAGAGEPTAQAAAVQELARELLRFVAAYNLFDALLMVMVGAIKGAGDTQFVLRTSLVMGAALAGMAWLCVETFAWGIYASWMAITAWVWTGGIVYLWRFRGGAWRSMRVIEGHATDAQQEPTERAAIADADGAEGAASEGDAAPALPL
jgi:MATE family multidrug resistance protein